MHDRSPLNFSHFYKFGLKQTSDSAFWDWQITESNFNFWLIICLNDFSCRWFCFLCWKLLITFGLVLVVEYVLRRHFGFNSLLESFYLVVGVFPFRLAFFANILVCAFFVSSEWSPYAFFPSSTANLFASVWTGLTFVIKFSFWCFHKRDFY